MNPLRNNLEIWFGSHPKIGIPAYAVISVLPIAITFANSDSNKNNNVNNQERRSDFRQRKAQQFEVAKQKKQVSVFSITTLDIVVNFVVSTGLSTLLNLCSAKMLVQQQKSVSAFLQSWSQQNDFNGRIRGYFYKKFFRNFFFIPKSWSSYFFPSDPKTPQEFKYIISHKNEENNNNNHSSPITFSQVFVDYLQRNLIESIARASAISVGLLLLHIPTIRKILRPPEAMLLEQPGLMAQLAQHQQSDKIENEDDGNISNSNDMQLQMIEALTTPTEGQTIDSLKWVWMGEFKVLVVNAVICGIVRKIMKNGGDNNSQERAAEVEFWVGNYFTFLVAKGIDLIVLLNSR